MDTIMSDKQKYYIHYQEKYNQDKNQIKYFIFEDGYTNYGITVRDLNSAEELAEELHTKDITVCSVGPIDQLEEYHESLTDQKYEYVMDDTIEVDDQTLYRIRAVRDFSDVEKGDLGGYIPFTKPLSEKSHLKDTDHSHISMTYPLRHDGNAWVYDDAKISGKAFIVDNVKLKGNAHISDHANAHNNAIIDGDACVKDFARVTGNVRITDDAEVLDFARIMGNASISNSSTVKSYAVISGNAKIKNSALISGNANISGNAIIQDHSYIYDEARVSDSSIISDSSNIAGSAVISGASKICDDTRIYDNVWMYNTEVYGDSCISGDTVIENTKDLTNVDLTNVILINDIDDISLTNEDLNNLTFDSTFIL